MAGRYYKVGPSFWMDHAWGDDERLVALYLLTCPHRSTEGLFRMPLAYATTDLGWPVERFRKAFDQLLADGFVEYDEEASVCLIVNALKWQRPENPNQVKSAVKALEVLPRSPLQSRFVTLAQTLCPTLAQALSEGLGKPPAPTPPPSQPPLSPPKGGRQRDRAKHEQAVRDWAPHVEGFFTDQLNARFEKAMGSVKQQIGETFESWFAEIHLHGEHDGRMVLAVPAAKRRWVVDRFKFVWEQTGESPVFVPCDIVVAVAA